MNEMTIQQYLFSHYSSRSAIMIPNFIPSFTPARPIKWGECDIFQVAKSMYWVEFEIKLSVSDFHADFKKVEKHRALAARSPVIPRRFWYVMPDIIADKVEGEIPEYAGLMVVNESSRYANGFFKKRRDAPTLKSTKITAAQLQRLYERFYWRYWYQRNTIIDLTRKQQHYGESL